jgi:hypothetical protein
LKSLDQQLEKKTATVTPVGPASQFAANAQ